MFQCKVNKNTEELTKEYKALEKKNRVKREKFEQNKKASKERSEKQKQDVDDRFNLYR